MKKKKNIFEEVIKKHNLEVEIDDKDLCFTKDEYVKIKTFTLDPIYFPTREELLKMGVVGIYRNGKCYKIKRRKKNEKPI